MEETLAALRWLTAIGWILSLTLICAQPVLAQQPEWEHLLEITNEPHIIALALTTGLAAWQIKRVIQSWYDTPDAELTLPTLPHDDDVEIRTYLRSGFEAPFIINKILPHEELSTYATNSLQQKGWLVSDEDISRTQRQQLLGMVLLLVKLLHKAQEHTSTLADTIEQSTDRLNEFAMEMNFPPSSWAKPTEEIIQEYLAPLNDIFGTPLRTLTPRTVRDRIEYMISQVAKEIPQQFHEKDENGTIVLIKSIEQLRRATFRLSRQSNQATDLQPLLELFAEPIQEQTIEGIAKAINKELTELQTELQRLYPQENMEAYKGLTDFVRNARKFTRRATTFYQDRMASVYPTELPPSAAEELRKIAPQYLPFSGPISYSDLTKAYQNMNQDRLAYKGDGKQPATPGTSCRHPADLANVLRIPISSAWQLMLDTVQNLMDKNPIPITTNNDEDSLFRATDAPEFKDRKDYWSFRSSLQRFKSGIRVKDKDRLLALNRLLSRFTGNNVSDAANRWNVTELAQNFPTWDSAYAAFLAELDRRFLDVDFLKKQEIAFTNIRPRNMEPQEFMLEFETRVRTLQEAADLAGVLPITNGEIMRTLMKALPWDIRNKVYDHIEIPAEAEFFATVPRIIKWWHTLPRQMPKQNPRSNATNPQVPVSTTHPENRVNWADLVCDKPCFDTTPAIHGSLRGPWRELKPDQQRGLHAKCRRPLEEHNHMIQGCNRPGPHMHHLNTNSPAASRSIQPSGNDPGDE